MHEDDPSEGQERDFVLVDHEVAQEENVMDLDAQNPRNVKDLIIKEKEADIRALSVNLERENWIIKYLEQENKQLNDIQAMMELQIIREERQEAKKTKGKMTSMSKKLRMTKKLG